MGFAGLALGAGFGRSVALGGPTAVGAVFVVFESLVLSPSAAASGVVEAGAEEVLFWGEASAGGDKFCVDGFGAGVFAAGALAEGDSPAGVVVSGGGCPGEVAGAG